MRPEPFRDALSGQDPSGEEQAEILKARALKARRVLRSWRPKGAIVLTS
jgi:hypothetical protein